MKILFAAAAEAVAGVVLGMKYRGGTRSQCPKQ
jgi:hypothetical protein